MKPRTKKKLLLLVASLAAAVVLGEVALRIFFAPYLAQIYRLDDRLLHDLVPDSAKYFVHHPINGGERVLVEVDAGGFRSMPVPAGSAARVAVFGDSCVMAEFSSPERSFVGRLGLELGDRLGRPVEMVNAGVVAYGPDQACLRLERDLAGLDADLAVLVVFADNDFGDLMRNKLFRLGQSGELVENDFEIGDELRRKFADGASSAIYRAMKKVYRTLRQRRAAEAFEAATPESQRAAAVAEVEQWIAGCEYEYRSYILDGNNEVRFLFEDHFDSDVAVAPDSESGRYKIRLLGAVLGRAGASSARMGVPLLIVVLPSPFVLCGPEHGGVVDRQKHPEFDPKHMTAVVARAAEAHGLPCVDLFDDFAANDPDSLYYLAPDNHWNDAGQTLAARVVAEHVVERKLLDARDD